MTKGNPRVGQRRHQIASLKIGRIIHCHPSPEFDVCNLLESDPGISVLRQQSKPLLFRRQHVPGSLVRRGHRTVAMECKDASLGICPPKLRSEGPHE
jgi:hypothetical protein